MFRVPDWKSYWYDYYYWFRRVRRRWDTPIHFLEGYKKQLENYKLATAIGTMKKYEKCSWCGKIIDKEEPIKVEDAAHTVHYFHSKCNAERVRFMRERV